MVAKVSNFYNFGKYEIDIKKGPFFYLCGDVYCAVLLMVAYCSVFFAKGKPFPNIEQGAVGRHTFMFNIGRCFFQV
jgi:hypothetical protein